MKKVVKFGGKRVFREKLRAMAEDMIARVSPVGKENIRWLSGPVYIGATGGDARYTGTFEDLATGEVWRFTYFYRDSGRYTVEKEDSHA